MKKNKPVSFFVVKGEHEVFSLLNSSHPLTKIILDENFRPSKNYQKNFSDFILQKAIPAEKINRSIFVAKIGSDSQGIAAIIPYFRYAEEDVFFHGLKDCSEATIVALDHLEDPRNLGAIIRTAEIAGCRGILIPKDRAASISEWVIRTSQGAVFHIPIIRVTNLAEAIIKMQKVGFWVFGLSENAEKAYWEPQFSQKSVLVAGGEDQGLSRRITQICDDLISIPMSGKTPSLNVSVSVGIALFEILRQLPPPISPKN